MIRNPLFLYETLDALASAGMLSPMPDIIERNLASSIQLREYQVQAFQNFVTYFENENLCKNKQVHTLFHMATGSGKTIIMAGLILYLYTKGYRKFLFFVNQTNILEKTKLNFTDAKSSKYLFAETVSYLGREIQIRPVINFAGINHDSKDIHIYFTSTQKLHLDLFAPQENSLTNEDFEDDKIVFISDESHHVNTLTKKATKDEEANRRSWEYSVMNAFTRNRDNVLLEFTATADIKDRNVRAKYLEKMIMDYPLAKFRQSGYTKDFQNFATDTDLWTRALIALVMSEYRKYLFTDVRQNIKPVIMMKSQRINDSENFYDLFFRKIEMLDVVELESLYAFEMKPLQEALDYFTMKHGDLNVLCRSIKDSFTKETSIIMNGARDDNTENQILVNSLEDKNNPIRLIFAVDMLNEGWDVLNLFDIVRLYDTRQSQSGGKIGSYTIKEAQLIGRAARYCPFVAEASQERFQRKYDNDLESRYRYLETMYFHSKNDSRYINELKQALIATGLQEEEENILEYKIKDTFKSSDLYLDGLVFSNQREEKERSDVYAVDERLRNKVFNYHTDERRGQVINLFDVQVEEQEGYLQVAEPKVPHDASSIWRSKLKEIPYNIVSGAASGFYELSFSVLKMKYPNLKSLREFLCSEDYIGNITIEISYTVNLETKSIYKAVQNALITVAKHITEIKQEYQGSTVFEAKRLKSVVKDKKIKLEKIDKDGGRGASQINNTNTRFALDLAQKNWYIFNDNYGTREEKLFLRYFDAKIAPQLKAKNLEFYVIRNERIPDLAIYSFDTGERFEPDFLLFIRKRKEQTFSAQQVYVEPKGSHLLLEDAWKEQFLLELTSIASVDKRNTFGNDYKIIGLPFFNEEQRLTEFEEAMESFIETL